jgi:hypothetical protein
MPQSQMRSVDVSSTAPVEPSELRAVLAAGQLAPSVHNTQPWRFVLNSSGIEVHGDDRRLLKRIDSQGRELVISCGAAIFNIRVAAAAMGRALHVQLLPDFAQPMHLATLTFADKSPVQLPDAELYPAVSRRHSHRRSFDFRPVQEPIFAVLADQARREGVEAVWVDGLQRRTLSRLLRIANLALESDSEYRRELRGWTTAQSRPPEGVPATGFGTEPECGEPPLRDFTAGMPWLGRMIQRFGPEGWLALSTRDDDARAWITAGQAVQRVLLEATQLGLAASFMTQSLEIPQLRTETQECLGVGGIPQVILRLGKANPTAATGRRPLDRTVVVGGGAAHLLLRRDDRETDEPWLHKQAGVSDFA